MVQWYFSPRHYCTTDSFTGLKSAPPFAEMPQQVAEASPISLWNASLEIHTGRVFEPILGNLYILVAPVTGLFTLFILVTGFFSWWLSKKKKKTRK